MTELTSATQTVTVTNSGGANLLLGTVALANPLAPPFAIANDTCTAATVPPTASCTFDVTFSAGLGRAFTDSFDIPSNDADEPSVTVAVSGNGVAQCRCPTSASPTPCHRPRTRLIPFGSAGTSAPQLDQTVTVTNDGNADLVLGTVGVANGPAAPFSLVNDNCSGQTVAPAVQLHHRRALRSRRRRPLQRHLRHPVQRCGRSHRHRFGQWHRHVVRRPEISVTDNTLPDDDLLVPFGNVTEATTRDRTITVTNVGGLDLLVGTIGRHQSAGGALQPGDR